jgi:hypothetical protein
MEKNELTAERCFAFKVTCACFCSTYIGHVSPGDVVRCRYCGLVSRVGEVKYENGAVITAAPVDAPK